MNLPLKLARLPVPGIQSASATGGVGATLIPRPRATCEPAGPVAADVRSLTALLAADLPATDDPTT